MSVRDFGETGSQPERGGKLPAGMIAKSIRPVNSAAGAWKKAACFPDQPGKWRYRRRSDKLSRMPYAKNAVGPAFTLL